MSWSRTPKQDLAGEAAPVLTAALRYLSRREYTAAELRHKLKECGAAATDIETALTYAQDRGYQDDARAAESHIRRRLVYAPRGRALLRQELTELGVSAELSAVLLAEHYPPETEREVLQHLLSKAELPPQGGAPKARQLRQKMARRLLAKGFAQSLVLEELAKWLPAPNDDEFME